MEPVDFRSNSAQEGVTLVVRPHCHYGFGIKTARGGQRIIVDAEEAKDAALLSTCMTVEAYEQEQAERARRRRRVPQSTGGLKSVVEAALQQKVG